MSDPSDMETVSSSPVDSTNLVSVEDADAELMNCDDLLNENKISCPEETYSLSWCSLSQDSRVTCTSSWCSLSQDISATCTSPSSLSQDRRASSCSSVSEDGRLTSCSWCSSSDSDVSEDIPTFDQNLDEEIKMACQRFLNGEYLEKEEDEFDENGSASILGTGSQESVRPASCAACSSTVLAITDTAKVLISEVLGEAVKTLVATEPPASESVKNSENAPLQTDLYDSVQVVDAGAEETVPSPPSSSSSLQSSYDEEVMVWSQSEPLPRTGFQEEDSKNETLAEGYGGKKKKSHWRAWFGGEQTNNSHSVPQKPSEINGESKEDTHCSKITPSSTSTGANQSDQLDDEHNTDTKSSRLSLFFRNMFSKKKQKTKSPFWMRLFHGPVKISPAPNQGSFSI